MGVTTELLSVATGVVTSALLSVEDLGVVVASGPLLVSLDEGELLSVCAVDPDVSVSLVLVPSEVVLVAVVLD